MAEPEPKYVILQGIPTPQVYHDLRKNAGLTPPPSEPIPAALSNSFYGVLVWERSAMVSADTPSENQTPVGMGRLVGDGHLFLIMVDICVDPNHQRQGLGQRIVQALIDYIDEHSPYAYVSLVADPPGQKLYPKFGFKDVKPSLGMFRMKRGQRLQDQVAEGGDAAGEKSS